MNDNAKQNAKAYLESLEYDVIEVRIIANDRFRFQGRMVYPKNAISGYYQRDQIDTLISHIAPLDGKANIYTTIQQINPVLRARASNRLKVEPKSTTSDQSVTHFCIFPIDIDPQRESETSASDAELEIAKTKAREIANQLEQSGIPIVHAMSGNGCHILVYLEPLECTEQNVKRFKALGDYLANATTTDDLVSTDSAIYNPSRILKLYGTMAVKGDSIPERPHRISEIFLPKQIQRISFDALEKAIHNAYPFEKSKPNPKSKSTSSTRNSKWDSLEHFLNENRVQYTRTKEVAEGTVYYLACPFDSTHDGDAFVIDRNDGKWGFKCYHNSCADKDWNAFREVVAPKSQSQSSRPSTKTTEQEQETQSEQAFDEDVRLIVDITGKSIDVIYDEIREHWDTLKDDSIFVRADHLSELSERGKLVTMTDDLMHYWLAKRFAFKQWSKRAEAYVPVNPIRRDIIRVTNQKIPAFVPELNAIYRHPIMMPNWEIANEDGYYPEVESYVMNDDPIDWESLDTSEEGVKKAKSLLMDDLLVDFPFASQESRVNYIGYLLSFAVRPAIGHIPLFAITAPVQGAGKGLLANLASMIWEDKDFTARQLGSDDRSEREEMRKRITAYLMESPESIVFDNAVTTVDSHVLASALTTGSYMDRILGASKTVEVKVRAIMAITGNNLNFAGDMSSRVYHCRLVTAVEKPELRTGWTHQLEGGVGKSWASVNRIALMEAMFTMAKAWIEAGRPVPDLAWRTYTEFAQVIGGILQNAGIEGFLASLGETDSDELIAMREFCAAVYADKVEDAWTVKDVFEIASYTDEKTEGGLNLLGEWLSSDKDMVRRRKLGNLLKQSDERIFGGYQFKAHTQKQRGQRVFSIKAVIDRDGNDNNREFSEHEEETQGDEVSSRLPQSTSSPTSHTKTECVVDEVSEEPPGAEMQWGDIYEPPPKNDMLAENHSALTSSTSESGAESSTVYAGGDEVSDEVSGGNDALTSSRCPDAGEAGTSEKSNKCEIEMLQKLSDTFGDDTFRYASIRQKTNLDPDVTLDVLNAMLESGRAVAGFTVGMDKGVYQLGRGDGK